MNNNNTPEANRFLLNLLRGYVGANKLRTEATLGDRSQYIGMSDVSKAFGCLRAAVANRVFPKNLYPSCSNLLPEYEKEIVQRLERLRPLERGHEQEHGLAGAFEALGYDFVQQLEVRVEHENVPIHVHLDFVVFKDDIIEVVESKSNEITPDTNYAEYEAQVYGQIGFLQKYYSQPVFSVRRDDGSYAVENTTLPGVAWAMFGRDNYPSGTSAQAAIQGWLLSMSGTAVQPFGPYKPSPMMTEAVLNKAVYVWETAQKVKHRSLEINEVEYLRGFHPLCDYCAHNHNCPKFTDAGTYPELGSFIYQYKEVQGAEKVLAARKEAIKKDLFKAYSAIGFDGRDFIATGDFRFRRQEINQSRLNKDLLIRQLESLGFDEEKVKDILAKSSKISNIKKLDIGIINKPAKSAA